MEDEERKNAWVSQSDGLRSCQNQKVFAASHCVQPEPNPSYGPLMQTPGMTFHSIGSALCSSWISTVTANNHYILTRWSRWWRLAHRYFPWPARPADLLIEYAFFIDFAERSCSYSGVECPTHSHQSLVESQGHRRGWPHSSCDLLHDGTARDAKLLIEELNLEPYLQLGESKSRVSIVPL